MCCQCGLVRQELHADAVQTRTRVLRSSSDSTAATRPLGHVVDAGRNTLNEVVGLRRLTEPTYLNVVSVCVWDEVVTLDYSCTRSAVYKRNKIGPRTEPCGTPYSSSDGVELDVVDRTCCIRPCRYDLNQSSTTPSRPYDVRKNVSVSASYVSFTTLP